jgi:ADP-ribose pyrophosphatase YjhB (NUDIX family)
MKRIFTQTFVVVGAILVKDDKILLVREIRRGGLDHGKWSHPAGWIEVGEDPITAVKREVQEESGYDFTPTNVLGIYSLVRDDMTEQLGGTPHALKVIFTGNITEVPSAQLHDDVSETKWFSPKEIYAMEPSILRDLDIKQMVKDYFAGRKYPLELIKHTVVKPS